MSIVCDLIVSFRGSKRRHRFNFLFCTGVIAPSFASAGGRFGARHAWCQFSTASEAAVARAEAELAAWETENDATAGEKNRLKVAVRQAASAAAAARLAKEEHARAISSSVVPAMMKRAEAALAEDSLSMSDVPELVLQLSGGGDKRKERAAAALANLAGANDDNISNVLKHKADVQAAIAAAGGIAPLVALVRSGTDGQKVEAAAALRNLAVPSVVRGSFVVRFFIPWAVTLKPAGTRTPAHTAIFSASVLCERPAFSYPGIWLIRTTVCWSHGASCMCGAAAVAI